MRRLSSIAVAALVGLSLPSAAAGQSSGGGTQAELAVGLGSGSGASYHTRDDFSFVGALDLRIVRIPGGGALLGGLGAVAHSPRGGAVEPAICVPQPGGSCRRQLPKLGGGFAELAWRQSLGPWLSASARGGVGRYGAVGFLERSIGTHGQLDAAFRVRGRLSAVAAWRTLVIPHLPGGRLRITGYSLGVRID